MLVSTFHKYRKVVAFSHVSFVILKIWREWVGVRGGRGVEREGVARLSVRSPSFFLNNSHN